jgi:hypothetical protein
MGTVNVNARGGTSSFIIILKVGKSLRKVLGNTLNYARYFSCYVKIGPSSTCHTNNKTWNLCVLIATGCEVTNQPTNQVFLVSVFFCFSHQTPYALLVSAMRVTYPAHATFRHFTILIVFGEVCKLRNSSLCSLLQPPIIPPHFSPYIVLFSTLLSIALSLCFPLNVRDQLSHPYKTADKNGNFVCFNLYVFRQQSKTEEFLNFMVANIIWI